MSDMTPTSQRAFNRAEKILNRWVNGKILTQAGKDWLVAVLDPFHDTELTKLDGWPDVMASKSLVRKIKQQVTLTKPGSLAAGNWDCIIVNHPFRTSQNTTFGFTVARTNNTYTSTAGIDPIGGLQAWGMLTATGTFFPVGSGATNPIITAINVNTTFLESNTRLIGGGFEVVNTTPVLTRGGAVTVWQMQNGPPVSDVAYFKNTGNSQLGATAVCHYQNPPSTLANANLITGARTWNAQEGCYMTYHFQGVDNPPKNITYTIPMLHGGDDVWNAINTSLVGVPNDVAGAGTQQASSQYKHIPMEMCGAWFTGLDPTTTLVLTEILYIETFPTVTPNQLNNLVLATPSAEYDPMAMQVYTHAINNMPCGVPVSENPAGEWFFDVVDKISNMISGTPGPIGLVAKGVNAVNNMIRPSTMDRDAGNAIGWEGEPIPARKRARSKKAPNPPPQPRKKPSGPGMQGKKVKRKGKK